MVLRIPYSGVLVGRHLSDSLSTIAIVPLESLPLTVGAVGGLVRSGTTRFRDNNN